MTALVGGLRSLGITAPGTNTASSPTAPAGHDDFFVNLLSPGTRWVTLQSEENVYEIRDVSTQEVRATAAAVDLVFGSNSQLRALSKVYASGDGEAKFVSDFVAAWVKVMENDRVEHSG